MSFDSGSLSAAGSCPCFCKLNTTVGTPLQKILAASLQVVTIGATVTVSIAWIRTIIVRTLNSQITSLHIGRAQLLLYAYLRGPEQSHTGLYKDDLPFIK